MNFHALLRRFSNTARSKCASPVATSPSRMMDIDASRRLSLLEVLENLARQIAQVDRLAAQLGARDAGQVEEVANELIHAPGPGTHAFQVASALVR